MGNLHDQQLSEYRSLNLNESQWAQLEQIIATLQVALCEAEVVCVSLVYPIINSLINKHLLVGEDDLPLVKSFKTSVSEDLKRRFTNIAIAERVVTLAAALDVPTHHFGCSVAYGILKDKCRVLWEEEQSNLEEPDGSGSETEEPLPKKSKNDSALNFLLGESDDDRQNKSGEEEVERFLQEKTQNSTCNVLDW